MKKMCFNCSFFHIRDKNGKSRHHKDYTPIYFCGSLRRQVKFTGFCIDWTPSKQMKDYLLKKKGEWLG